MLHERRVEKQDKGKKTQLDGEKRQESRAHCYAQFIFFFKIKKETKRDEESLHARARKVTVLVRENRETLSRRLSKIPAVALTQHFFFFHREFGNGCRKRVVFLRAVSNSL